VQTWAWDNNNIPTTNEAKNSYVLRLEYAWDDSGETNRSNSYGYYDGDTAFALLPMIDRNDPNKNNKTFMHGPRAWNSQNITNRYVDTDTNSVTDMSTTPFNADTVNELTKVLYTSPLQRSLTEDQLAVVHFVPLRFPGGIAGAVPELMSTDWRLDVDALRASAEGYVEYGDIALAWDTSSGKGKDTNQQNRNNDSEFPATKRSDTGTVINYVLRRGATSEPCNGLLSHCNYAATATATERDEVHTRYVVYFEHGDNTNPMLAKPNSVATDPFGGRSCKTANVDVAESWYAIGMDFNANGEFLGYITRTCQTGSKSMNFTNDTAGVQFAVIATLYDQCTDYATVYDPSAVGGLGSTNKAWTNRVWSQTTADPIMSDIENSRDVRPYGSLVQPADWLETDKRANYSFYSPEMGVPYACRDGSPGTSLFSDALRCAALPRQPDASATLRFGTVTNAKVQLLTRFAKFYREGTRYIGTSSVSDSTADVTGVPLPSLLPPQIYGVHPVGCRAVSGVSASASSDPFGNTIPCTAAAADTITINDANGRIDIDYDGDGVPDEDTNRDGNWDGLIGRGSYFAVMRFFAFADHERMPIKTVKIDWNDGLTQPYVKTGLYENKKPFCGATVPECVTASNDETQLTCSTDGGIDTCDLVNSSWTCSDVGSQFGNQDRACMEGFFEHTYTYVCTDRMAAESGRQVSTYSGDNDDIYRELTSLGLTDTDYVCTFTPRVQVTDNWGWCNGTCDGTPGCYEGGGLNAACSNDDDAWTEFAEEIIVIPR
jgi:hypothetical protein